MSVKPIVIGGKYNEDIQQIWDYPRRAPIPGA